MFIPSKIASAVMAICGSILLHACVVQSIGVAQPRSTNSVDSYAKQLEVHLRFAPEVSEPVDVDACKVGSACYAESSQAQEITESTPGMTSSAPPSVTSVEKSDSLTSPIKVLHYHKRQELTQPPVLRTEPYIALPEDDDVRLVGIARIRLYLSESGEVDDIGLVEATLPEEYIQNVIAAYREVKFHPGKKDDLPVKSQLDIEVSFTADPKPLRLR